MQNRQCRAAFLLLLLLLFLMAGRGLAQQPEAADEKPNRPAANQTEKVRQPEANAAADDQSAADELPAPESARQYPSWLWNTVSDYWARELFVVGDRAFHLGQLIRAAIVFFLILFIAWVARIVIHRTLLGHLEEHAETTETLLDDALVAVVRQTRRIVVILLAAYLALITLPLSEASVSFLHSFALVVVTTQAAIWANAAFGGMLDKEKQRRASSDPSAATAFGLMGFFARVAVWSIAVLLVLSSLGYPIGPLLAGLGVGGVAVAFALQHILGDIFCSIAIVLDKPFVIGDFIVVNDLMGTVENIGIKTTRLRSLGGEQIVFSNADLIGSRVRNYKRMFQRRIVFAFGVVYETPLDKLKQIPQTVRTIIEGIEKTRFDRAHFKDYGDSALNFEVVYFVLVADFNVYMDIQQEINLRLFQAFEEAGIAFAYPTQEIIMRPSG
jgi:MscS family membrane protein